MDELEEFSREYKKRLDVAGDEKVIPEDLALEVYKENSLSPMNRQLVRSFFFFLKLDLSVGEGIISRSREAAESSRGLASIQGDAYDSKLRGGNKL